MRSGRRWAVLICSAAVFGGAGRLLVIHNTAHADAAAPSTRASIDLTIYSDDFGMVHESRPQQVAKGDNHLQITDISKLLDPQSVSLEWKGQGDVPQVVAQAYDLGVGNENELTKRLLGRSVDLIRYGQNGQEAGHLNGKLVVQGDGGSVIQSDNHLYLNPVGTIVATTSSQIVTMPQLSIQAESAQAQNANLDITYLTRGISWSADYVATLSPKEDTLDLQCWATVLNKTGVDYPLAHVQLIAGSPNRAAMTAEDREQQKTETATITLNGATGRRKVDRAGGSFGGARVSAPVSVGDLQAYPVSNPTNVVQEQMNRILMLASKSVKVVKDYNTRTPDIAAWDDEENWGQARGSRRGTVAATISFINAAGNGLGLALPHGNIRLYEPAATGAVAYIGAADIIDTPDNERVDLTLANAFDLFTEWRTVKREKVAKHAIRKTVEISLHNEKSADAKIRLVQGFSCRWKIVAEPLKHANLSASELQWIVPVKAHSTLKYTFTVELAN